MQKSKRKEKEALKQKQRTASEEPVSKKRKIHFGGLKITRFNLLFAGKGFWT
jgi:hypothetical protein